jgi:hypothetical protein
LQRPLRSLARVLPLLAALAAPVGPARAAGTLGDRLVVSINNVPYTQRQVEVYIAIKESLRRPRRAAPVRLVSAGNWSEAVKVFSDDMLILQEAVRLGSFQTAEQNFDKYEQVVRARCKDDDGLRAVAARLGIDDLTIAKTLETVLRVAAFRRSKDRQAAVAGAGAEAGKGKAKNKDDDEGLEEDAKAAPAGAARWFVELEERAVVRMFQDAHDYVVIDPTAEAGP